MPSGLLIKLRPAGPWRIGPDSGVRDRVDRIYHSDSLYAAVCWAMAQLGSLEEWRDATARSHDPMVRFGSCFPFAGDTLFVAPPKNLWPPPESSKIRWKGAKFVPLSAVESLVSGRPLSEEAFQVDGESQCLLPVRSAPLSGPYRVGIRSSVGIDRTGEGVIPHSSACLEFAPGAGLWTVVQFAPSMEEAAKQRWKEPIAAAFRLLADSGFGGERSRGWGRAEQPEIEEGELPGLLLRTPKRPGDAGYWLLSLFHPSEQDTVDWQYGNYSLSTRGGRIESAAGWGEPKQLTRMVTEGSVLVAASEPNGAAKDVAPLGFAHPVYRSGFALTIPIPLRPQDQKQQSQKPDAHKPGMKTALPPLPSATPEMAQEAVEEVAPAVAEVAVPHEVAPNEVVPEEGAPEVLAEAAPEVPKEAEAEMPNDVAMEVPLEAATEIASEAAPDIEVAGDKETAQDEDAVPGVAPEEHVVLEESAPEADPSVPYEVQSEIEPTEIEPLAENEEVPPQEATAQEPSLLDQEPSLPEDLAQEAPAEENPVDEKPGDQELP